MPPFTSFASRVNAGVTPVAQRQRASGIGESLTALGRTTAAIADQDAQVDERVKDIDHDIAMRERTRDDNSLRVNVAVEQAKVVQRLRVFEEENRTRPDYETVYAAQVDKEVGTLRGLIGNNDRVLEQFDAPLTSLAESEKAGATIYAAQVRAKAQGQGLESTVDIYSNALSANPTGYAEAVSGVNAAIDGLEGVPDALKPHLKREAVGRMTSSMLAGQIDGGRFAQVGELLNSGKFDNVLDPATKHTLLQRVDAEGNAARIQSEHLEAEQKALFVEEKATIATLIAAGADVPFDRIEAAAKVAQTLGERNDAAELGIMRQQVSINRAYRGKSATERAAAIGALAAKEAAGKATPVEQISLKQLRTLNTALTQDEVKPLRQEYAKGVAGRVSVADGLLALPPQQRYEKAEAVHEGFGAFAVLPDTVRTIAIQGQEDLPAVAKHFEKGADRTAFKGVLGSSANEFQGGALEGTLSAAKAIYAFRARRAGTETFDPQLFSNSVNEALGARKVDGVWHGGVSTWNNGRVILPDGYSQRMFSAMIDKTEFGAARILGGKPLTKAQVLAHYRPVYLGDSADGAVSQYQWVDVSGAPLGHKAGGVYRMDVRN